MGMNGNNEADFSDISSHWAQNDIRFAASIGWVTGYPNGTYRPNLPITRAEFMTLVNRMLKRIPLSPDDLLSNRMFVWKDNSYTSAWFYLAVQEATNSHIPESRKEIVAKLNFPFERWIDIYFFFKLNSLNSKQPEPPEPPYEIRKSKYSSCGSKSGMHVTYRNLSVFMKKYVPTYSIRIFGKNYGFENSIKSVLLYATFCI